MENEVDLPEEHPENVEDDHQVLIDVASLIIGREIKSPIYDRAGVLLLSEGSTITDSFKEKLIERDIKSITVDQQDADVISVQRVAQNISQQIQSPPRNNEVDEQLRLSVKKGLTLVSNDGPAARDQVNWHGNKGYSVKRQDDFQKQSQIQCDTINDMLKSATRERQINGVELRDSIESTLNNMCDDFDCMNAAALHLAQEESLAKHCHRMSVLGMSIAVEMGLNDENVCRIGMTGLLHDWGMIEVPEEIRNAKRELTILEQIEMQKHVMYTANILDKISGLPSMVSLISYQVHEQMNGKGYPRGRPGDRIHLFARILNVAHTYVELTTPLPHREALSPYEATLKILKGASEGVHDVNVVRALLRAQSLFPVGSLVMLSSGCMARVLRANGDRFTEPIVQLIQDSKGNSVQTDSEDEGIFDISSSELKVTQALPILHEAHSLPAPHFLAKSGKMGKTDALPVHAGEQDLP